MAEFDHLRAGDELVVQHLVQRLFRIVFLGVIHAGAAVAEQRIAVVALVIDLVEGHPVLHFSR